MATVYRFPICIWKNPDENYTARIVDDEYRPAIAIGATIKEATEQLREYLTTVNKHESWNIEEPDFLEPEMRVIRFSILPEYEQGNRIYSCREKIRFRLPCIVGKRSSGGLTAALPTMGIFFDYQKGDSFEKLAIHFAQRALSGHSPQQLSRLLPPRDVRLDQLSITLREVVDRDEESSKLKPLSDVADHIGVRDFRRVSRTWEREQEVWGLARMLGEENASVCLVGETDCGKTSVLVEAARRVERLSAE
jgi:hypothetical protein